MENSLRVYLDEADRFNSFLFRNDTDSTQVKTNNIVFKEVQPIYGIEDGKVLLKKLLEELKNKHK